MATQAAFMPGTEEAKYQSVLWSWLTTVDHKRIGILYGASAFMFFLVGGIEAIIMRLQLARPRQHARERAALQRAVHDARHDDDLPRRDAAVGVRSSTT